MFSREAFCGGGGGKFPPPPQTSSSAFLSYQGLRWQIYEGQLGAMQPSPVFVLRCPASLAYQENCGRKNHRDRKMIDLHCFEDARWYDATFIYCRAGA